MPEKYDKMLRVRDGWIECPICHRNRKLLRITPETKARSLPVFCRSCKREIIIDIERGQSQESRSPC